MRISDWSSDVCSSDLLHTFGARDMDSRDSFKTAIANVERFKADHSVNGLVVHVPLQSVAVVTSRDFDADQCLRSIEFADRVGADAIVLHRYWGLVFGEGAPRRSEAHTSELQALMRISYAVFSLNKT